MDIQPERLAEVSLFGYIVVVAVFTDGTRVVRLKPVPGVPR
ncbi:MULTISPECIES: hypothetical protein [Bradyrhizobium]|nr:hypothetical protein [Bradyrhizobium elkanii]